ncbi:hypothetical protein D3C81_1396670 [compost metagenome]
MHINAVGQLLPAVAQVLVAHHQSLSRSETRHGVVECLADSHGQQGLILAPLGIARLIHGGPLLWLFWELIQADINVAHIYVNVKVMARLTVNDGRFTLT